MHVTGEKRPGNLLRYNITDCRDAAGPFPGISSVFPGRRRGYDRAMAQITNLNRFRKDKARAEKRRVGDENAAKHGRTKAQKAAEAADAARAARTLDQHRRDDA